MAIYVVNVNSSLFVENYKCNNNKCDCYRSASRFDYINQQLERYVHQWYTAKYIWTKIEIDERKKSATNNEF